MHSWGLHLLLLINIIKCSLGVYVSIKGDGPIVRGGTIHLEAIVHNANNVGKYKYEWMDNGIPRHTREVVSSNTTDYWSIEYDPSYPQGTYVAQVEVKDCLLTIICFGIGSYRYEFNITETLNGDLDLIQNNKIRTKSFVSNVDVVNHSINIKESDAVYIRKAPKVLTYWFVDCIYYGFTENFEFSHNYTKTDELHVVEALVVADFTPIPPPPVPTTTTTTTVKPTTTSTTPTPTTKTTPTTKLTQPTTKPTTKLTEPTSTKPSITTTKYSKHVEKRSASDNVTSQIMQIVNGKLVPYNVTFPYVCNSSMIVTNSNKTYGYFSKKFGVKEPVRKVNVTGNNWLQHGAILSLNVQCQGSKPLYYCINYKKGIYNVTGNETCEHYAETDNCKFPIQRYLPESMQHTVVIIIENDVGRVVTPVAVTIYKVQIQAQLSVVVIPVAFSLVAVVIIIFAVAYYFQNRSRFVVEVADFNFGQKYNDMEYKTFSERLTDSIINAFTRAPTPSSSEVPVWPPGRKYGSMT